MNNLLDMVWVELLKAIRSRVPLWTISGSLLMPSGMAFLMFLARNPKVSEKLGLVGAKARLMEYAGADWPTYLGLLGQIVAVGGFLLSTFVISWVFGREFVDGTLKDILAVPVPRSSILLAKFMVAALWSAVLTIVILVAGLAGGAVIGLPGGSAAALVKGGGDVAVASCLVVAAVLPIALPASVGRGYLLPIGAALFAVMMANLMVIVGLGEYFPWAVPALYAQGKSSLTPFSYWIASLTGLAGVLATYVWWKFADQSR